MEPPSHVEHSNNTVGVEHTSELYDNACLIVSGLLLFRSGTAFNSFPPTANSGSEKCRHFLIMQNVDSPAMSRAACHFQVKTCDHHK